MKEFLDNLYLRFKEKFSSKDPVWNVHRFHKASDVEIVGLISSAYAYGRVEQINSFIEKFLDKTGNKPYEFTINFEKRKDKKFLKGLSYRFHTDADLIQLIYNIHNILIESGSLKEKFLRTYNANERNIIKPLTNLTKSLRIRSNSASPFYYHLIPDPEKGSTCKRLNLYLRWMIRKDNIDLGVWKGVSKSKLLMPVDTHIARISKKLNLVKRKSVDLKFSEELTNNLKKFDPDDPVKYDFALCHAGIEKVDF